MHNNKDQDWFYLEPVLLVNEEEHYLICAYLCS